MVLLALFDIKTRGGKSIERVQIQENLFKKYTIQKIIQTWLRNKFEFFYGNFYQRILRTNEKMFVFLYLYIQR